MRREARPLLVVWVSVSNLVFLFLLLLSGSSTGLHFAELALVLSVSNDLLASHVLSLHGDHLFSFLFLCLNHFLLSHLLLSFIHYCSLLLWLESLEMVWLNAMSAK